MGRRNTCPGTARTGLPRALESSMINYPDVPRCYDQHLICGLCLGGGISCIWYMFSFFFLACFSFHSVSPFFLLCTPTMRAGFLVWWDATVQTRCGSLKTSCWLPEGKKIPNQPAVAPVCPLKPQWPDHISAEAGNHRTIVGNRTHNAIFICGVCAIFNSWSSIDCCCKLCRWLPVMFNVTFVVAGQSQKH